MADINVSAKIAAPASGLAERPGAAHACGRPSRSGTSSSCCSSPIAISSAIRTRCSPSSAFGRAHHRVLHFVNRNPGMKVADLLDILNITKQSLGRVLKQLVDQGFVVQKEGAQDRRQRLLYVTPKGEALALKLAGLQTARINRAFAELGPGAHEAARRFLTAMIDADNREGVLRLIARADRAAKPRS